MNVAIEILTGKDVQKYIVLLSRLRVNNFKEYPYLYEGSVEYEKQCMQGYISCPRCVFTIAKVDGKIAGVLTGIPLVSDSSIGTEAEKIFKLNNLNPSEYYYYGEIFVLKKFRNLAVVASLFTAQNSKAKDLGYKYAVMLTVVRQENHPLKPKKYKSLDQLWARAGFSKMDLTINCRWPTIRPDGSIEDINNLLEFWMKKL